MTLFSKVSRWLWMFAAIPAVVGCGGDDVPAQASDDDSTSSAASTSTGEDASTDADSSSSTADQTDTTTDASSSSTTDDESSSTGEPEDPESIAIRILTTDAGNNRAFFRYRVEDFVADGPTQLHPPSDDDWEVALHFPDRRMVYGSRGDDGGDVWLGSLDDPLPFDVVQLDTAPVGPTADLSFPIAIPNAEAVVFVDGESAIAYRVDFPGGVATPPVAVASGVEWEFPLPIVDPSGTNLLFNTSVTGGASEVVRASLVAPDPDAVDVLSDLPAGGYATVFGTTPSGDGVFLWVNDADPEVQFVDISAAEGTDPVPVVEPLPIGHESSYYLSAADPVRPGFVYCTNDSASGGAVRWIAIEGGTPQPPITIIDGVGPTFGGIGWTPDGEWLLVYTGDGVAVELQLVHFEAGAPEPPISVGPFDGYDELYYPFGIDSDYIYLDHQLPGDGAELLRRLASDGDLGPEEVVIPSRGDPSYSFTSSFTNDRTLLFGGRSGDEDALYTIDLAEQVPGAPVLVSSPLAAGEHFGYGLFSPGAQFVGYEIHSDISDYGRLMLVHRDSPGQEIDVTNGMLSWRFAYNW